MMSEWAIGVREARVEAEVGREWGWNGRAGAIEQSAAARVTKNTPSLFT
jgi:hypothetical protein